MPLSWNEIRSRSIKFSKKWEKEERENAESKSFWDEFFYVFGVQRKTVGYYEFRVKKLGENLGFIDFLWPGKLIIEHKSRGKDLDKAFEQVLDYIPGLKEFEIPQYILISDFDKFHLYDLEERNKKEFKLKNLSENIHLFDFIAGYKKRSYIESDPVNIKAAELMGKLHDNLKENEYEGHQLEVYLVRLLFCLFADDTGIFQKDTFLDYIQNRTNSDGSDLGSKLHELFQYLNVPEKKRPQKLDESIKSFPYINGKLFEEKLDVASFDKKMRRILFDSCHLDWSKVSPAIFGSLFQSVMDPDFRRNLGAHYTSETNILKLINPLFIDELWNEFYKVKHNINSLKQFHNKLSDLKFFDPACGCGNFLIIAYRELRLLETEVIKILYSHTDNYIQKLFSTQDLSKIDVDSFFGIEIEEFPARIAEVSMWMMDHLMNKKLSDEIGYPYTRLPLRKAANIHLGNALQLDWKEILVPNDNVFILGNPPFAGKQLQDTQQKNDMKLVFKDVKKAGVLDYVTAWYIKASQYIQNTKIKVGFVSTNSISQGEQVSILWNELFNNYNIKIHFAHNTFKWSSEAKNSAAVYVVIIGFANFDVKDKYIFEYQTPKSEAFSIKAKNINPYLAEGDDLTIKSRRNPVCDVLPISFGSMPNDGGNFLLSDLERIELINDEPDAEKYIKPLISGREYLNGQKRWCLWLKYVNPSELKKLPLIMRRVQNVKIHRLKSSRKATRDLAKFPTLFGEDRQPDTDYVLIPLTSSENREYIPLSFFSAEYVPNNTCSVVKDATLYHFGVLMSEMHMTWVKYVCGRLESRYRYSNQIVYNNFPWPESPSKKEIKDIKEKSQKILDIRDEFKSSSLADLYNPILMPPKLRKAHNELDKVVDKAYGKKFDNDSMRMKFLFELYQKYTSQ